MDIQTLFYTLACIFMILGIIFVTGLILLLWKAEKSALSFKKNTTEQIAKITDIINEKKFIGLISVIGLGIKWLAERNNKRTS